MAKNKWWGVSKATLGKIRALIVLIETLEFEFVLFIPSDLYATWVDRTESAWKETHTEKQ